MPSGKASGSAARKADASAVAAAAAADEEDEEGGGLVSREAMKAASLRLSRKAARGKERKPRAPAEGR